MASSSKDKLGKVPLPAHVLRPEAGPVLAGFKKIWLVFTSKNVSGVRLEIEMAMKTFLSNMV